MIRYPCAYLRINKVGGVIEANHDEDGAFPVFTLDISKARTRHARLMTLAPELFELLVRYRNEVPLGNQPHMIAHEVDALIAKATGESHG